MTVLSAQSIRARHILIDPFHERTVAHGMTFGVGPAGYDIRIDQTFRILPGDFALASSIEAFYMPTDLQAVVHDKSTWARLGLFVQNSIIDPGWRGHLTLELTNDSNRIIDLSHGMPIAQIVFHLLDHPTDEPYVGKYQDQAQGPQAARSE